MDWKNWKPPIYRVLTKQETNKYATQIEKSRKEADSYVFGYKKKEMVRDETDIVTLALGEDGAGWIPVAHCKI